jgi:hypothetical protein
VTDAAAIVARFRRAVQLLAEFDDEAATTAAAAIDLWLLGQDFETAAGLAPGWRRRLRGQARDTALQCLVSLLPELDDLAIAERIVAGLQGLVPGVRADGEDGYYFDLNHAGIRLSVRQWRRLVADVRGQMDRSMATRALSLWSAAKPE